MDNLTHSLIGAAVGETAAQWRIQKSQNAPVYLRPLFWTASILANNFPDIDAVYSWITPGRLGYLLHHRGHTHTLLMGVPQAAMILFFLWLFCKWKNRPLDKSDWIAISTLTLFGTFLHLFADSWNSYGVHPFWPWSSAWFYGDFIFIVEPWIWVVLMPPLFFAAYKNWLRKLFGALIFLCLGLIWFVPYVVLGWKICLTLVLALGWLVRMLSPMRRMAYAIFGLFVVLLTFKSGNILAQSEIEKQMAMEFPHFQILDRALSPAPGNLACWSAAVALRKEDQYGALLTTFSIFPDLVPLENCPNLGDPYRKKFTASISELKKLVNENCSTKAAMQFLRIPYWEVDAENIRLGDLRFERRNRNASFSQLSFPRSTGSECPPYLTNWLPPRSDILLE